MERSLQSKVVKPTVETYRRPSFLNRGTLWVVLFIGGTTWALARAGLFQRELVNQGGWTLVLRFIESLTHPELSPAFLKLTLDATLTTLAFAVIGIFLSVIMGFVGGILASQVWWQALFPKTKPDPGSRGQAYSAGRTPTPWLLIRSILAPLRAIHEVIWGLFFVNVIGLDPLSAILAIAIPYGAIIAKVFSEILDETPRQPFITLLNSGVSPPKAFAYTLIPQAFSDLLSYSFYRFECAIRSAAVLGIIGAGGLGYQIFLSLQTLKYEQIWTLLFALFLLNGMADFWSSLLRRRVGSGAYVDGDSIQPPKGNFGGTRRSDRVVQGSILVAALLVPLAFLYIRPDASRILSGNTLQHLSSLAQAGFPPNFGTLPIGGWFQRSAATLAMSLLAVAGAGVLGLILSYLAANNFLLPDGIMSLGNGGKFGQILGMGILISTRGLLLVARSIPAPIWALILLFVLFPGILPGAAALGLYTLGVLGRLMAEVIENIDQRPLLALKAGGASSYQVFAYGALPLTFPRFVGYLLYRWEEAIRATVVIGLVGAGGLGRMLVEQLSSFDYQGVAATLVFFIGITFLVDLTSAAARRAFREA